MSERWPHALRVKPDLAGLSPEEFADRIFEVEEIEEHEIEAEQFRRARMKSAGFPSQHLRHTEMDSQGKGWVGEMCSLDEMKGPGLLIWGEVGRGKTVLAVQLGKELVNCGYSVLFFVVPELLQQLRAAVEEGHGLSRFRDRVRYCDVLILDDLGKEKVTNWVSEEIFTLIDYRNREGKPVIITTNKNLKELSENLGEATVSRIVQMTRKTYLKGYDRRMKEAS